MDERNRWNRTRGYSDEYGDERRFRQEGGVRGDYGRESRSSGDWDRGGLFGDDRYSRSEDSGSRWRNQYDRSDDDAGSSYGPSSFGQRGSGSSYRPRQDYSSQRSSNDYAWNYGSSPEEQYYQGFGGDASSRSLGRGYNRDYTRDERGFLDRAADEVASWFGDEDAERRREQDYRGRGPSGYTRSDERIREDANDRLTEDVRVDASYITVSVENGELTLDGTVNSRHQKRRAEDCVEDISGVRHVQNNLRVSETSLSGTDRTTYGESR